MAAAHGASRTGERVELFHVAEQAVVDETAVALTMLTDLSAPLPHDFSLDFQVDGFDVAEGKGSIMVLLDNSTSLSHHGNRIDLRGVPAGHHFLRAVLLDEKRIALKSCMAYVEAEFYVVTTSGPMQHPRPYMFGVPTIMHLSPRDAVPVGALSQSVPVLVPRPGSPHEPAVETRKGLLVDWFVHNCEVNREPHGFAVAVYINNEPVATVRAWSCFLLTGLSSSLAPVGGTFKLRMVLLNPAGEEVLLPPYNSEEYEISVLSDADAKQLALKGPGVSVST